MKKIVLNKAFYKSTFEIEVPDLNGSEIKIFSSSSRIACLGKHYDITIFTKDNSYYLGDIGNIRGGLCSFFIEEFLKQNIIATVVIEKTNDVNSELYKLTLREIDPELVKIKNNLELLKSSKTNLRFIKFTSIANGVITVEYFGHKQSGSYVYASQVAPEYIKTLQYESNRIVKWVGREEGGFGGDIYTFKVFIKKIICKNVEKEIIKGKRYHIDTTNFGGRQSPYAFRLGAGREWAMMYSISENINNNKAMPGLIIKKDRIVNIHGIDVFKIITDAWEKDDSRVNSGRTHFKGTFDLLIPENEFTDLYLKFYGELNNCFTKIIYFDDYGYMLISSKGKEVLHLTDYPDLRDDTFSYSRIGHLPITINN